MCLGGAGWAPAATPDLSRTPSCLGAAALTSTNGYYDRQADAYVANTAKVTPTLQRFRAAFLAHVPAGGRILELGAGPGRDAHYFESLGFVVTALEPSAQLVARLRTQIRGRVIHAAAQELDDAEGGEYDGTWALASLIHAAHEDLPLIFGRVNRRLKVGGVFASSFVSGVGVPDRGEFEPEGRYFNRASESFLRAVAEATGYDVDEELTGYQKDDYHSKKPTEGFGWFNFVLKKRIVF